MYKVFILESGESFYVDAPRYVKLDGDIWRRCSEVDAECLAVNGQRFSIAGKNLVKDAPQVVIISPVDAGQQLNQIFSDNLATAQNVDEIKSAIEDITDAVLDIYLNGV